MRGAARRGRRPGGDSAEEVAELARRRLASTIIIIINIINITIIIIIITSSTIIIGGCRTCPPAPCKYSYSLPFHYPFDLLSVQLFSVNFEDFKIALTFVLKSSKS